MAKQCHILAVDDNALNRGVIERIVTRKGHRVTLAEGGKDALDKIEKLFLAAAI